MGKWPKSWNVMQFATSYWQSGAYIHSVVLVIHDLGCLSLVLAIQKGMPSYCVPGTSCIFQISGGYSFEPGSFLLFTFLRAGVHLILGMCADPIMKLT